MPILFRLVPFLCVFGFIFQATASLGQESGESKFLHILIVGDTVDPGVGKSVETDIIALKELFENGIPPSKRSITILADDFLTPDSLFAAIDNLQVDADDSLLLYYCGHGIIDEEDNHLFALTTGKVPRSKILEAMQKKNPRLCVLISDSCAILTLPRIFPPAPHFKTVNSELMRYLFFCAQGLVDINSARSGEFAFCSDTIGGYFTDRFRRLFDDPTSELVPVGSDVPTWETALAKITEMLIPSEEDMEAETRGLPSIDESRLLEIERTRGIRVFRDRKVPNLPIQHPVAFSALPAVSYGKFPTGENTLGFTYRIIPDKEIQVNTVAPGSMAMWNGLETGDSILGFERLLFDLTSVQEVPVPPDSPIKPRATRLDAHFDFDTFLLSNMPVELFYSPNTTPGWMTAVVQKSSDNRIVNIPISTSKSIEKKDLATLTPDETPYFWQLAPQDDLMNWVHFADLLPDGSALVIWRDHAGDRNWNYTFDRVFLDGTRKNLYQYQTTHRNVNQATLDSNGKVRAFLTTFGEPPYMMRQGESPDLLPGSLSQFFFFPHDMAVCVSNHPRFVVILEYNQLMEASSVPTDDHLRTPPRMIEFAQEERFFVHAFPETGQIQTMDSEEFVVWNVTDATKAKQISLKDLLSPSADSPHEIHFVPEKDLLVYTYFSQEGPRLSIWDVKEGARHIRTLPGWFRNIHANSTGTRMLTNSEDGWTLWNLNDGTTIGVMRGVFGTRDTIAFSPDGKTIAGLTRGWYGEAAMLWDAETGRHLKHLGKAEKPPFRTLRFTPDGKRISLLSYDGVLQVVDLE
jgi:hypothetical protein